MTLHFILQVVATVLTLMGDQTHLQKSIDRVKLHLGEFMGVSRRFEEIGKIYRCHLYDDYAHHPKEVRAVLQAARQKFPDKSLCAVFQPHTYRYSPYKVQITMQFTMINAFSYIPSRLVALKDEFAAAFVDADQVIITAVENKSIWFLMLAVSLAVMKAAFKPEICNV